MRIRGIVERITYQNPENGFTILKCYVKGYSELVPVRGNLLDANVGSILLIEGSWKVDSKYGRQFEAESWEETMPATVYGMEKYLGSGLIKGIGPVFAKRIVQQFGESTIDVIENDVQQLSQVSGIGSRRIQMIAESWEKQKEIRNVMLFLREHNVSTSFAAKIYKHYGNESILVVKENPYRLADDIWGIGFKTADQIAGNMGINKNAFIRLRSGIMYTLSELSKDGHVYAEKGQLVAAASKLLEAEEQSIMEAVDKLLAAGDLIQEKNIEKKNHKGEDVEAIYLPPFYYAEIGVAGKLKKLLNTHAVRQGQIRFMNVFGGNDIEAAGGKAAQEQMEFQYDEVQLKAIRLAVGAKVMILTGGPGTGKTTTTQGIISNLKAQGLRILLAAPTGRAAKRMTEATGIEAKTIHRLLECKPPEGYQKNEDNPLRGDVLIVDECSMIDILLMNSLLKAMPLNMRLILVGDIDQLPSVGAGNVLRDMIDSCIFPVVRLTKIFRQAQTSKIITNAHRINQGQLPEITNGADTDFFFQEKEDPDDVLARIVKYVSTNLPQYYHVDPRQIQVLTPMQRGVVGASSLNLALQEVLNPPEHEIFVKGRGAMKVQKDTLRRGGYAFRAGDKVMQIRNNYEKEVFNGDIGFVETVNTEDNFLKVIFDNRIIEYDITELDELVHAYATTVHKAQGSEYPIVVMPVLMNHYVMLQRNLIYTGITRAKKILVMIGSKKALTYAIRNVTVFKRNTLLQERLKKDKVLVDNIDFV